MNGWDALQLAAGLCGVSRLGTFACLLHRAVGINPARIIKRAQPILATQEPHRIETSPTHQ